MITELAHRNRSGQHIHPVGRGRASLCALVVAFPSKSFTIIVDDELLQVEIVRHRVERNDVNEDAPTFATLWPTGPRGI